MIKGRWHQWKTTLMEENSNGRQPQWKVTPMEGDLNGRWQQWNTTSNGLASQFSTELGQAQPQHVITLSPIVLPIHTWRTSSSTSPASNSFPNPIGLIPIKDCKSKCCPPLKDEGWICKHGRDDKSIPFTHKRNCTCTITPLLCSRY